MSMTIFPATGQSGTEPNLSENTTPSTNNRNAEYRLNPINGGNTSTMLRTQCTAEQIEDGWGN